MTTSTASSAGTEAAAAAQAAVAKLPERIVTAWAAQDAEAFAEVFTVDGTMILPGVFRQGRAQIKAFMADAFATVYQDTKVTGEPVSLRFFGDTVAVLITKGGVLAAGETEVPDERAIRASWLAVKEDGKWQLAAYQNSPLEA